MISDNTLTNDPLGVNPPAQLPHSLATPHPGEDEGLLQLGMISHKNSLITIFGYKHKIRKFIKNLTFFTKKVQQPLILVHIWYQISNFEA